MRPIFLDTVGLIALWDTDDQWHAAADVAYQSVVAQRRSALTTAYILLECGNTAARRTFRSDVCALRRALELRSELIVPTGDDWRIAWAAYEPGEAGYAGIVDHVSFAVMRRLGITEAFTNDRHFRVAGFETLVAGRLAYENLGPFWWSCLWRGQSGHNMRVELALQPSGSQIQRQLPARHATKQRSTQARGQL